MSYVSLIFVAVLYIPMISIAKDIKDFCPMEIIPAKTIGPFSLNSDLISIKSLLPMAKISTSEVDPQMGKMVYVEYKGIHMSYCNSHVQDIWIDLQSIPTNCLIFKGKKVRKKSSIESLRKLFGGCKIQIAQEGGTFYECEAGLRIGVGAGRNQNVIDQIRIGPGLNLECTR